MNNDITKYIRNVYALSAQVHCFVEEVRNDASLSQETREDLVWELCRLKDYIADCVASLTTFYDSEEQ